MLKLIRSIFAALLIFFASSNLVAQNLIYSESFTVGSSYCPGSTQFDNWGVLRSKLDTTTTQFLKVTIKGTYDATGRTCTNKWAVRKLAAALKAGSLFSISCDGYTWRVGGSGSCYSGLCGSSSNETEFSCDGTGCSCANPGYSLRPCITNSNWGGVNTSSCGGASQTMTVIFEKPSKNNDMAAVEISPLNVCTYSQAVKFRAANQGINQVDSFYVGWSVNNVFQSSFKVIQRLPITKDTTVTLNGSYAFSANTVYKIKAWTFKVNGQKDSVPGNDTTTYTLNFAGSPLPPTTVDITQCGVGRAYLKATPQSSADSILWYDALTGGNLIGKGKTIQSPVLQYGVKTFYAESSKAGASAYVNNGLNGGTIVAATTATNVAWMNVKTANSSVALDSFMVRLWQFLPNSTTYTIYYRVGVFNGFETNGSAWTLLGTGNARVITGAYGNMAYLRPGTLNLQPNTQYAFHVAITGNDIFLNSGAITASDAYLSMTGGSCGQGIFGSGGVYTTWTQDMRLHYRPFTCTGSARSPLKVTVNPSPTGSDVLKGSTYQGQFKSGTAGDPDIVAAYKTLIYELTPPKGGTYTNLNHGTKWKVNSITLVCKKGYVIPSTDYSTSLPSASANGSFTFKPGLKYVDSTVTAYLSISDLGPYFCDTTIKRNIYVAPTPFPDFRFPQPICDGSPVLFDNKSTISKGTNTYMWYFGDGDSSDNINPVHTYKTFGQYNVRLVATSDKFGIVKDTTIQVLISEIPNVAFKPTNACEGVAVKFTNLTTVSAGTLTYDWDFGDNTTHSVANSPSHLYAAPGGYKVTLSATANGCTNTLTKNAYEFARPKAGFTAPVSSTCAGTAVVLPNTSTISLGEAGSYWNFGDGVYSTALTGVHAYAVENTYNVKLKMVSEFGCADSITKPVTIKPAPKVSFTTGKACSQTPSIFTNTTTYASGQNPSYTWSFSDGGTATTTNVTHPWGSIGPKTIVLSAIQANGCTGSSTQNIDVLVQPTATFNVSDICSGENAVFENQTTIDQGDLTYLWDFGDNTTSTISDPLHPYTVVSTKTYNVVLIAGTAGGCSDTARKVITVNETPLCGFTTKVDWPNGYRTIKFVPDNSSYSNYTWSFGEGGSSSSVSPLYQYLYDGVFRVKLKTKNTAGCECEKEIKVAVGRNQGVGSVDIASEVNIYPNPNNGMFTVSVDDAASSDDGVDIEVYNTLGERIYTIHSTAVSNLVNLGGAARGIYIIKIKSNGKTTTRKVSVN